MSTQAYRVFAAVGFLKENRWLNWLPAFCPRILGVVNHGIHTFTFHVLFSNNLTIT